MKAAKKVSKLTDIMKDERIEQFIRNYDGPGKHMVACKDGFRFEGDRTIEIGTIAEICYSINEHLDIYNA